MRHLDPEKLAKAYERWRTGKMSLKSAAHWLGVSRDALRYRFPEFEQWRDAKRRKSRDWHDRQIAKEQRP